MGELGKCDIVNIPDPELHENTVLVRPHYVGVNPCDYLVVDYRPLHTKGQIVGCDFAGVIEAIGSNVKTAFRVGDTVCGVMAGGAGADTTRGCFAELTPAYPDYLFRIPAGLTESQAASLGVGLLTIAAALYHDFDILLPTEDTAFGQDKSFFIYGGSTSTGLLATQLLEM